MARGLVIRPSAGPAAPLALKFAQRIAAVRAFTILFLRFIRGLLNGNGWRRGLGFLNRYGRWRGHDQFRFCIRFFLCGGRLRLFLWFRLVLRGRCCGLLFLRPAAHPATPITFPLPQLCAAGRAILGRYRLPGIFRCSGRWGRLGLLFRFGLRLRFWFSNRCRSKFRFWCRFRLWLGCRLGLGLDSFQFLLDGFCHGGILLRSGHFRLGRFRFFQWGDGCAVLRRDGCAVLRRDGCGFLVVFSRQFLQHHLGLFVALARGFLQPVSRLRRVGSHLVALQEKLAQFKLRLRIVEIARLALQFLNSFHRPSAPS